MKMDAKSDPELELHVPAGDVREPELSIVVPALNEQITIGEMIVAREPLLGARRVEIQNLLQDTHDMMLNQKATP